MLGKRLVRRTGDGERTGRIVEVEAYVGEDDGACHARWGRTPRGSILFGPPGRAYVFLIYGMYHCLNFVVEREGFPAAILVRAVEPLSGIEAPTNGPGKVCLAFAIDRSLNGEDTTRSKTLWLEEGEHEEKIATSPRVGVAYAGRVWAAKPWRFFLAGNAFVSKARGVTRGT
ncbi:DNA-3-methyladenine glycosylase [bacterium]|nr:DNA-3-methyladenine glycosylase [bacterium]